VSLRRIGREFSAAGDLDIGLAHVVSEVLGLDGQCRGIRTAQQFVPLPDSGQFPAIEPAAGRQFATIDAGVGA